MLDGVVIPVQQMVYSFLYFFAETLWGINQAILLVGYYVLSITSWLSQQMFQPLLASIGNSTDSLLLPVFTMAMLTLGITYLLGTFGVFRVVEFKSAVIWCAVAVMWFQFGPEIYLGFESFRRNLSGGFYGTVFNDVVGSSGTIEGLGQVGDGGDMQIDPPTNNFGPYLSFDTSIDGLDIALAYLDANGCDVLRAVGCLYQSMPDGSAGSMPFNWYRSDGNLDITDHAFFYGNGMTQAERQSSLDQAARAIWVALSGTVVSTFGLLEQIIQLLLTVAFGIAFASFFIAILFAFFKKTEPVTWAVFDIILGLFIQSIINSLLLALVLAFVSVAGATGNGILLLGVGFLGIILVVILLIGAAQAILGALNGLMGAFGQATNGNLSAAGTVTQLVGAAATGGATLATGGTIAQSVGASLGPNTGQQAYYASRAFGGESTTLGRMANEVAQGATASYAGPIGGAALGYSNRRANRERVEDLTLGTPIQAVEQSYNSVNSVSPNRFPSLNALASEGQDTRVDVVSNQPYAFRVQDNGDGVRTYEDGSRVYTDDQDIPSDRNRAKAERDARRNFDTSVAEADVSGSGLALSETSLAAIDASDDEENARLLSVLDANRNEALAPRVEPLSTATVSDDNSDIPAPVIDERPGGQPTASEAFLLDIELANPGATGREDLVATYYPDGVPTGTNTDDTESSNTPSPVLIDRVDEPSSPRESFLSSIEQDYPQAIGRADLVTPNETPDLSVSTDAVQIDLTGDVVTNVPQVGQATQARLAGAGISTAGELANASSQDLAAVGIGQRRAGFLINQAQEYVAPPANRASVPSADQIAAAGDAVNNDDGVRLANRVASAIRSASTSGGIASSTQAQQVASQAGLPNTTASSQFVQVASAMGLNEQQAQTVIQDVQNNNALGAEIGQSIRASLATLTLANGSQLNNAGMEQAVGLLEGAARSLVSAANSLNGAGGAAPTEAETATAGSNQPQTTASNT
ncbi:MAG: helix-hairpin-helix domain-containing protein [Chloroflexota bacterium]